MIDVAPVQNDVQHHRIVVLLDEPGDFRFQFERARAAQEIVQLARAVLKRQLDVVQPCGFQRLDARLVQPDPGRDEIRVEAQRMRLLNDLFQIVAHHGFAAGEAELHRAERARFAQHPKPGIGSELLPGACELRGVRAIHAMQRAPIGELQQQPQRRTGAADRGG